MGIHRKPSDAFDFKPPNSAERIIAKFGGVPNLVKALCAVGYKIGRVSVYKWKYPTDGRQRGLFGGKIPEHAIVWVKKAARYEGIFLDPKDFK